MDKHPISDIMDTTMQKIREMVDVNTIVGDPITTADNITLIPISKVSFGFTSGGTDFRGKNQPATANNSFGGGVAAGVHITPVAFIVASGGSVKMMSVAPPASTTLDRVIETVPEIVDLVSNMVKENKDKSE